LNSNREITTSLNLGYLTAAFRSNIGLILFQYLKLLPGHVGTFNEDGTLWCPIIFLFKAL